jgi:hypothetical protein
MNDPRSSEDSSSETSDASDFLFGTPPEPAKFDSSGIPSDEGPFQPVEVPGAGFPEPIFAGQKDFPSDVGEQLDDAVTRSPIAEEKTEKKRAAAAVPKAGPPTLAEWEDFFGRIVFRTLCEWYVTYAFRGVPEDIISDDDLKKLVLSREERQQIAAPLASLANKSKFARTQGRRVIAAVDSVEALVLLGMWVAKVNRIASKYRPEVRKPREPNATPANDGRGGPEFVPGYIVNPGVG